MPEVTSGLYKVTLVQSFAAQIIINTFYFTENLDRDDQQLLCAKAFDETILPAMASVQSQNLTYSEIIVDNPTGTLAAVSFVPTTTAGTEVGLNMPSFVAATIKLSRTTKETRNGSKRVGGMTEENVVGNGFIAGFLTQLQGLADVFADDISTVGAILHPVILKTRNADTDPFIVNPIAAGIASPVTSSQVSRKAPN